MRPVTDAELTAYRDSHRGWLADAGDWVMRNREYLIAGALVIIGGVAMASGVGAPLGMGLISAGLDVGIQRATTGQVSWAQAALAGGLGAVGGGAYAWAARFGKNGPAALRAAIGVNAGVNAAGNTATYGLMNWGKWSMQGFLGAVLGGLGSGAIGGIAGPAGGTIAKQLGAKATGPLANRAAFAINTAGGTGGYWVNAAITRDPNANAGWSLAAGLGNGAGGFWGSKTFSSPNMTTLSQISSFGPRTTSGVINLQGANTRALWGQAGVGTAVSGTESGVDTLVHAMGER